LCRTIGRLYLGRVYVANLAEKLLDRIKGKVYAAQVGKLHKLNGKHVERDGVTFLVTKVDWRRGKITVSDTGTPLNQTTEFNIKSFLSKAVTILREEEKKNV